MRYFDESDFQLTFRLIAEHYGRAEEVPDYLNEREGVARLKGVFTGVRMDEFYPSLVEKATYLLTQINKGHFFSNGNKRLALVCAIGFLAINDKAMKVSTKIEYRERLQRLFPTFEKFEDQEDFSPEEYGIYNLSIIVADSHAYIPDENSFDVLKQKVAAFFAESVSDYEAVSGIGSVSGS